MAAVGGRTLFLSEGSTGEVAACREVRVVLEAAASRGADRDWGCSS